MIIKKIFTEAKIITTDENLVERYNHFNRLLFNNELPNNFPIVYRRVKSYGGVVKFNFTTTGNRYKRVTDYSIVELAISTFFYKTQEQIDGILVHEMIHIYLAVNGIF